MHDDLNLRDLVRWTEKPAATWRRVPGRQRTCSAASRRGPPHAAARRLSDAQLLSSAAELRGEVVDVQKETEDTATVTIRPGWGFSGEYQPGQYVGIGLSIDGKSNT